MVTLLGIIFQYLAVFLIFFYDFTLTKQLPMWMYMAFVFCLFTAQTLDAIDGKHARNTGRQSSLGQFMDHGCDALANSTITILLAQTHCIGGTRSLIIIQSFAHVSLI